MTDALLKATTPSDPLSLILRKHRARMEKLRAELIKVEIELKANQNRQSTR